MYLDYKKNPDKYWVGDTEADGFFPSRFWCAVYINVGTKEVKRFRPEEIDNGELRRWHLAHADDIFVFHNGISFDAYHLDRLGIVSIPMDRLVDTLVLSYLYNPHLPGGHSIASYGIRFGIPKLDHEDWSKFSEEMLARCERDVQLGLKVFEALCEKMNKIGFSEKSCEIEHYIREVIDRQQRNGFAFDIPKAEAFIKQMTDEIAAFEPSIHKVFPAKLHKVGEYEYKKNKNGNPAASFLRHQEKYVIKWHPDMEPEQSGSVYRTYEYRPFNIASPKQRLERMLEVGFKATKFTKKGNPSIDEESLLEFAAKKDIPAVQAMAKWLVMTSRKKMVQGWLDNARTDGYIHGDVWTCGAQTRRMTHDNPNTANIPSEANQAAYGQECRSMWIARPGRVLVGYDASGLEMRGLCHYLDNPEANELFLYGKPHQKNAEALTEALGFEVIYGGGGAKTLFYAFLYGSGDRKLGYILGLSGNKAAAVGAKVRETLLKTVPGLDVLVAKIASELEERDGLLQTVDGGFVRCPSPHAALNYKIQSAGGIVMKNASIILDRKIKYYDLDCLKVGDIHDEGQLDTAYDHGYMAGCLGVQSIVEAGIDLGFNVPLNGDFKIGRNWAETH